MCEEPGTVQSHLNSRFFVQFKRTQRGGLSTLLLILEEGHEQNHSCSGKAVQEDSY